MTRTKTRALRMVVAISRVKMVSSSLTVTFTRLQGWICFYQSSSELSKTNQYLKLWTKGRKLRKILNLQTRKKRRLNRSKSKNSSNVSLSSKSVKEANSKWCNRGSSSNSNCISLQSFLFNLSRHSLNRFSQFNKSLISLYHRLTTKQLKLISKLFRLQAKSSILCIMVICSRTNRQFNQPSRLLKTLS